MTAITTAPPMRFRTQREGDPIATGARHRGTTCPRRLLGGVRPVCRTWHAGPGLRAHRHPDSGRHRLGERLRRAGNTCPLAPPGSAAGPRAARRNPPFGHAPHFVHRPDARRGRPQPHRRGAFAFRRIPGRPFHPKAQRATHARARCRNQADPGHDLSTKRLPKRVFPLFPQQIFEFQFPKNVRVGFWP